MWVKIIFVIVMCIGLSSVVYADYPWLQDETLKITIFTDDILYEWEYENPDQFEYEEGNTIYRGDKAKKSFEEIIQYLDLSEPELNERSIQQLTDRYAGFNRMTIKKKDMKQCLQTWLWDKKQEEWQS